MSHPATSTSQAPPKQTPPASDPPAFDGTPETYLKSRVDFKIEAYRQKGVRYRWGYVSMASAATVGAAAVPVLINLEGVPKLVPTLLSLLVTVLVGLEGLLHFREHWRNYDLMKSCLRQEQNLFLARAGAYRPDKIQKGDAFALFVERVEGEIAKERAQTIEMRTSLQPETESQNGAKKREGEETKEGAKTED